MPARSWASPTRSSSSDVGRGRASSDAPLISPMELTYGTYVAAPLALRPEVEAAEAAGFGAVYFSEHHGSPGYVPNPLSAATFVLGCSSVLRSGPMPLLLPLHDPVRIAEEAALADAVSGGRLVMGLGAGYLGRDFEQCRVPVDDRGDRLEEAATILRRIWAGDTGPFPGRFDVPVLDPLAVPPAQPGGPPMIFASGTPAGIRRAARVGDGIVIDSVRSTEEVTRLAERFRETAAAAGRDDVKVVVMRRALVGAAKEVGEFVADIGRELEGYASKAAGSTPWLDGMDGGITEASVREVVLAGGAAEVGDQLVDFGARTGADEVIIKVRWTSPVPLGPLLEQLEQWQPIVARASAMAEQRRQS